MKRIESQRIIQTTEKNLRALLGDDFYKEMKEFFRHFITTSNVDKLLITRRAYVLYKIFCKIFFASQSEKDNDVKQAIKETSQCVYTTHSLPLLLAKREKKALLIVDDIIVNGRTIFNVIRKFQKKDSAWKLNLWCLRCNEKAAFLKELKPYLKHAIFLSPYEWEMVSDRLTDAVIMSNIGYVSFMKTYWLTENAYNKIFEYLSTNQFSQKDYSIKTHSKGNEGRLSLECNYFLIKKNWEDKDCLVAIRLYKTDWSYLAIPYIFLPSMDSKELLSLCTKASNRECGSLNEDTKRFLKVFSQNWTAEQVENCQDIGILAYQAIVNHLSNFFFETMLNDCLSNDFSSEIELCFDSMESFSIEKNREEDLHNGIIKSSQSKETAEINLNSMDTLIMEEIGICENMLESSKDEESSFLNSMKKYFTRVRREDDIRANRREGRLYGISVKDVKDCFVPDATKCSVTNIAELYLDLLYLWDTGVASCVILTGWDQGKKSIVFSEFIRHGEQAFRAIYSMYPDEYSVLHRFAEVSDSYSESEIMPFVQYYKQYSKSSDILRFFTQIEFETFFTDCMTVSPESVGANLDNETIDKIIKLYQHQI